MEQWQKYWRFHRRQYRRTGTRWYFIESWKFFTVCATITDGYTDGWCTSRSARMLEAWSVGTFTDGFVGTFADEIVINTFTDGLAIKSKLLAGFLKFFVRISINYRRNLMPPTIINVSSVIPSENCYIKPPFPYLVHFFSRLFISISLLLSVCI
jgi:hypothetical protein